jgi:exosortase family protein XrtF
MNWKEFRPTIGFLIKFIGFYLVFSLLYALYVTAYEPAPDPATEWVTTQSALLLKGAGYETSTYRNADRPTITILNDGKAVVSVYEGCNGLNVGIIFIAFLVAFGPINRQMAWYAFVGLLVLHISNLLRIVFLFWVALELPDFLYFVHKYLFTAIIYAVVFIMWLVWVWRFVLRRR